ncbi:MAG: hypothetical protein EXS35_08585 [Pedosphaera sp.]|nr:hypothetical protein [Pedosphaera sp.]
MHVLVRILRSRRFIAGCCALLLCGCSTFNRDWQRAAAQPAPPDSIAGRWEGRWVSEANGHSGDLRCLMTPATNDVYHARFRATYARVLKFGYTVPLAVQPHFDGWEFNGEANLGKLAGGIYYYEGRASLTNFTSTYRSKYDHGVFELARPK